ncbi:hypothetical protein ARMGADRAFT_1045495 [Armillaria gallica]|uniref:Uncharacterized protein n=1 Tax=Armillaria gallica TaxID=47427 RepID=A0A2H3DK89_ARMGA|nr:hypothetical protein ARMGADRAFT_1045495 [Armillaria gallica]
MPSFTATIQDYSPYSDNSMMVTNFTGASATFCFNGTGVNVYGAKRGNHGSYQVTLDGTTFPAETGRNDTGIFQTLLFSSITLKQDFHELILTNQGVDNHLYLDIDFITWQTSIGNINENLVVDTVQDTDPSFTYSPSSAWSSSPEHSDFYFGSTGQQVAVFSAREHSIVRTFLFLTLCAQGEGVSLYGPVGPGYAAFSAQLDYGPSVNSTAIRKSFVPQVLLYHADGLGSGQHPSDDAQELAVDFANVYTTPSSQSSYYIYTSEKLPVAVPNI